MDKAKIKKEPGTGTGKNTSSKPSTASSRKQTPLNSSAHSTRAPSSTNNNKMSSSKKRTPVTPSLVKVETITKSPLVPMSPLPNKINENKPKHQPPSKQLINKMDANTGSSSIFFVSVPSKDNDASNFKNRPGTKSTFGGTQLVSSGPSTPFTAHPRAETAGTNISNMGVSNDATGGDTTKYISKLNTELSNEGDVLGNLGEIDFSIDADFGSSFDNSSPTLNRKRKPDVEQTQDNSKRQKIADIFKEMKNRMISDDFTFLQSDKAVAGSSSGCNVKPGKYKILMQPIYNHIEGEGDALVEISNKLNKEDPLNAGEQEFLNYAKLSFSEWIDKGKELNGEYEELTKRGILARLKFDKRFQFILNNLDEFALQLEKCSEDIQKRSDILREYCSKIVDEIE